MSRRLTWISLSTAVISVALVAGCGSASQAGPPNGAGTFSATASNAVASVQWTRSGSSVNGTFDDAILPASTGGSVSSTNAPFTGTISGTGITLDVNSGGSTLSLVGSVSKTGFQVNYPGATPGTLTTLSFSPSSVAQYDQAVATLEASIYPSPCWLYVPGHDARLEITGPDAPTACARFVSDIASQSQWTTQVQAPSGSLSTVCSLTSGSDTAQVLDSGGQYYGGEACQTLSAEGWTSQR
jgi:hypothetical protein